MPSPKPSPAIVAWIDKRIAKLLQERREWDREMPNMRHLKYNEPALAQLRAVRRRLLAAAPPRGKGEM